MRLHRLHRLGRQPYAIVFVPDPICWTEAPESFSMLHSQRTRWQRGLHESLWLNRALICHPRGGAPGWLALPYMIAFEWLPRFSRRPATSSWRPDSFRGFLLAEAFWIFMLLAVSAGILVSMTGLLLEEMSLHIYQRPEELRRWSPWR